MLFLAEVCADGDAPVAERGATVRRMREVTYRGISRTAVFDAGYGCNHDALFLFRVVGRKFDLLGQYQRADVQGRTSARWYWPRRSNFRPTTRNRNLSIIQISEPTQLLST
ncbi:hypothetical protein P1P68_07960, partial [Streptomyces scabiei]|uniref:hypothetical protein n=1 Tax=Streptomyces scabiei TaxID=1930 RepID=UPI0029906EFF